MFWNRKKTDNTNKNAVRSDEYATIYKRIGDIESILIKHKDDITANKEVMADIDNAVRDLMRPKAKEKKQEENINSDEPIYI